MPKQMDPIKKQRRDQTKKPPKKRRKSESLDGSVDITNLIDINDDCLEHILKKLPIEDLLNVADSCKRFKNASRLAFKSKYGRYMVRLEGNFDRPISINDKQIRIYNFSACLKFMRCFGDLITTLDVCSLWLSERSLDKLKLYFNEYCADSVADLKYGMATLKHLTKSFAKVETVHFTNASFRGEPSDINRCFPNLRSITMHNVNAVARVMAHFPKMELLDIKVSSKQQDKLATVLRLNPQLQRLHICGNDLDVKFLRFLSKCPQLESLKIWGMKDLNINSNNDPIHFKSVQKFEVIGVDLQELDAANIAITFDQLDELLIYGQWDEHIFRFVSDNPNISKFTHWYNEVMNEQTVLESIRALPSVKELQFWVKILSADNVIKFIEKCPLLKYIECVIIDRADYDRLKNMIGAEWRSFFNEDCKVLKLER